jgi:hypothetical protein
MGFSIDGGTPTWMLNDAKSYKNGYPHFRKPPYTGYWILYWIIMDIYIYIVYFFGIILDLYHMAIYIYIHIVYLCRLLINIIGYHF